VWFRILLLSIPVAIGAWLYTSGLWQQWDPAVAGAYLESLGLWGPGLFVVVFALANGLGAPGFLFVLPAVVVWPTSLALGLVWLGAFGAGCVGFAFSRTVGRDWVASHLPKNLQKLDGRIAEKGIQTVIFVRLTMFLLSASHWALGLTAIRPRAFLLGSIIGFLPPVVLWTTLGGDVWQALREGRPSGLIALFLLLGLSVIAPRWLAHKEDQARS
jgi:uncharacterized membrane protein YdjX (TVP38/TMEM64 family)